MKSFLLTTCLIFSFPFFGTALTCLEEFNEAWNDAQDDYDTAVALCSQIGILDPIAGGQCQIAAIDRKSDDEQDAVDDYNCCEFAEC
ncbi:MAG: hypothetical protein AAF901_13150 [Bacteroidota bacterium]